LLISNTGQITNRIESKGEDIKNGSISKSVGIGSCIDHAGSDNRSCKIMEELEGQTR
jgi:hypothetical protein